MVLAPVPVPTRSAFLANASPKGVPVAEDGELAGDDRLGHSAMAAHGASNAAHQAVTEPASAARRSANRGPQTSSE